MDLQTVGKLYQVVPVGEKCSIMSGYAASITNKKYAKNKKSKSTNIHRSRSWQQSSTESTSVTGLHIRQNLQHSITFLWQAYVGLIFSVFIVLYVMGRRLISSRNRRKNPYSQSEATGKPRSGSYKDLSRMPLDEQKDSVKLKPPSCLEDPILGSHKFIKIQVSATIYLL